MPVEPPERCQSDSAHPVLRHATKLLEACDSTVFRTTVEAARRVDCGQCAALAGGECVYTTASVSVPVTAGPPVRPVRGYHAGRIALAGCPVPGLSPAAIVWDNGDEPRLPDGADDIPEEIDVTAAALLAGKIISLREYAGRVLRDGRRDRSEALGCVAAELARISVILAAGAEGVDDDDDAEPYCLTCGQWVGMFIGVEGWHHFRGEGTAANPVALHAAGHEVTVAWAVPAGRSLSPPDNGLVRQALADAHAADEARAASYDSLLRRLTAEGNTL
jgi:hypothetical protein